MDRRVSLLIFNAWVLFELLLTNKNKSVIFFLILKNVYTFTPSKRNFLLYFLNFESYLLRGSVHLSITASKEPSAS